MLWFVFIQRNKVKLVEQLKMWGDNIKHCNQNTNRRLLSWVLDRKEAPVYDHNQFPFMAQRGDARSARI